MNPHHCYAKASLWHAKQTRWGLSVERFEGRCCFISKHALNITVHEEEAYSIMMGFCDDDYPLLVIKNRVREGAKTTTFKHLNLAASIPLIACTMGRAFGDFSISKNEERAFSRAQVILALKSYRAHIKKDSRLHPIESLQLQPLQKSI